MKKSLALALVLVMGFSMLAGCSNTQTSTSTSAANNTAAAESTAMAETKTVDTDFADMTWDEVLAEAKGQTVTWYLWGGSTSINNFIDNVVGAEAAKYGVKINRVGVDNITQAVNMIIGEKQAGKNTDGTVDMMWINGSNFMMMKQAEVTFKSWSEKLPNSAQFVNWEDYSIANDMGYPVEGQESPWMTAQLQLIYDSSRINEADLPKNFTELLAWCKANPGRFTYPAPPDFMGTRFIKSGIYELGGGYEGYAVEGLTIEQFEEMSKPMFDWLTEIKPFLWRQGETYPQTSSDSYSLLNNNEIDFALTLNGMGITSDINNGTFPKTAKVYCMDTAIADTNYVALSFNGGNKAGAMVLANILLDPAIQAQNIIDTAGAPSIDITKIDASQVALIDQATAKLLPGTFVSEEEKARTRAPEVSSYLNPYIEQLFISKLSK